MQPVKNPYSVSRSLSPKLADNYDQAYEFLSKEQEQAAVAPPNLPYEIDSLPQTLGIIVNSLNNMAAILEKAAKTDAMKTKRVDNQMELIVKIKDLVFELNNSLADLKL
jgi:hypothetical protein